MPGTIEEKIFCITTYLETKSFKIVQAKFCSKFNLNLSLGTHISSLEVVSKGRKS